MTKLAPEWVRTSDSVIRSPARYRWTTAPALGGLSGAISMSHFFIFHILHPDSGVYLLQICPSVNFSLEGLISENLFTFKV